MSDVCLTSGCRVHRA